MSSAPAPAPDSPPQAPDSSMQAPDSLLRVPEQALALADQWAGLSKAMAIYPDTNQRVGQALDRFVEGLSARIQQHGAFDILFSLDALRVGSSFAPLPESGRLRWLQERLHGVGLAGARFESSVGPLALRAFTRTLLDQHAALSLGQVPSWDTPESPHPGIRPIERRFVGHFGADGAVGGEGAASWGVAGSGGGDVVLPAEAQDLPEWALDPEVLAQLRELTGQADPFPGEVTGATPASSLLKLLSDSVALLPADVQSDPQEARAHLLEVFGQLRNSTGAGGSAGPDAQHSLEQALHEVSHRLLARPAADATLPAPTSTESSRRPSDPTPLDAEAAYADFQERVSLLPPPASARVVLARLSDGAEMLGALLHAAAAEPSNGALEHCAEFIEKGHELSPAQRAVLKCYFGRGSTDAPESQLGSLDPYVDDMLGGKNGMRFARESGLLDPAEVEAAFPARLGLALETTDTQSPVGMEQVGSLLARLSDAQVRQARDRLLHVQKLGAETRLPRLMRSTSLHDVRAARMALLLGSSALRVEAVECLKRHTRDREDACLIRIVEQPAALPEPYLLALTKDPPIGNEKVEHYRRVSELLCHLIVQCHQRLLPVASGVEAVFQLARFPGLSAAPTLRGIVRTRWFLWRRAPAALRRAAAQVLYAFETRR